MHYRNFNFRCALDWLDLEVRTLKPHPAWRIRKASTGAFSYVSGIDVATGQGIKATGQQGKNTPTTRFAVRIQNPERFATIIAAVDTIKDRDPLAAITVRGIEIAFDAYRRSGTTDDQLAEMTEIMLRGITRPDDTNDVPRFYHWRGTTEFRYGKQGVKSAILQGRTAMYGNAHDDFIVRGYLKSYDTVRGDNGVQKRVTLPDFLAHRARIEIRLQGESCPLRTLDDLKHFRFESIARLFKFNKAHRDLQSLPSLIADKRGSLGKAVDPSKPTKRGRKKHADIVPNTQADDLSEIARLRLRRLTERWKNETGRGKAKSPAKITPASDGNSGGLSLFVQPNNHPESTTSTQTGNTGQHWGNVPVTTTQNTNDNHPETRAVLNTSLRKPNPLPRTPYQTQEGAARLPPSGGAAPSDGIPHQDDNDSWRAEIAALTLPPPALTENTTDL